jgi:hypothetical protein
LPDAHRAHAAVTGQPLGFALVQLRFEPDAVHRLQVRALAGDEVEDVADVLLHRRRRAQAIERAHDEGRVAQPAIAVVPVAVVCGASGIDVVIAAMIAPVSSYWHSFSVIALRITASCHSSGIER